MAMPATERKHFLDNLRMITVLLLFPYHVFMIYNNWGESWYIHGHNLVATSLFIRINSIWMMPLLFVIAGMSASYALERRSARAFAKERRQKLLTPLLFGVLLLVPVQSYIAGVFFHGDAHYLDFFTRLTDFSGYDGAFTPGHLWFIAYLFVISQLCLPLLVLHKARTRDKTATSLPFIVIVLLGVLPVLTQPVLNIGGKSFG